MQNGVVARAACIYTHNCSMQHMERIGGSVHPRAGVTPCAHIYVYMTIYYVDVNCILSVISQPASMTETGPQKNAELVRSTHTSTKTMMKKESRIKRQPASPAQHIEQVWNYGK